LNQDSFRLTSDLEVGVEYCVETFGEIVPVSSHFRYVEKCRSFFHIYRFVAFDLERIFSC